MTVEWATFCLSVIGILAGVIAWIPKYVRGIVRNEIKETRLHELELENERLRKYAEQSK